MAIKGRSGRVVRLLVLSAALSLALGGAAAAAGRGEAARELFLAGRTELYRGGLPPAPVKLTEAIRLSAAELGAGEAGSAADAGELCAVLTGARYELAGWYEEAGRTSEASRTFVEAEEAALDWARRAPRSAEAHAMLAMSRMRLTKYKGPMYVMKVGMSAKKEIDEAVRLDPQSSRVTLFMALWYQGAPEFAGGSLRTAVKHAQRALDLAADDFDRFSALVWLGEFRLRQGDQQAARECFQRALDIYPDARWPKQGLQRAEK